ncbi:hypothetical protein [Desulfovermiculus halophilus]|jgi:hypothetical protein|uniref:hypothetical protein n=1 Tax=Desulfovermiculus halophilus TaxID=339722 RepID=UPI00054E4307|nr:hypothetical protein [Desulfovermiculus halophilus]
MTNDKIFDYAEDDPASIYNRSFYCPVYNRYAPFLACPRCPRFPCPELSATDRRMLFTSPFLTRVVIGLHPQRRKKMYILKKLDGSLHMVDDLDEKNPDQDLLKDVEEVYPVTKVLVPQLKLVPKTKEERRQIKQDLDNAREDAPEATAQEPSGETEEKKTPKSRTKTKQS